MCKRRPNGFWNSRTAAGYIRNLRGCFPDWQEFAEAKLWYPISDYVGRFTACGPVLEDDSLEERDLKINRFLDHCRALALFADLLQIFRKTMERRFGRDCWSEAAQAFPEDERGETYYHVFRRVSRMNRRDAVETLKTIWTSGVRFTWPGGNAKVDRRLDCGITIFVSVTERIEKFLARRHAENHRQSQVIDIDERRSMPLAILEHTGRSRVSVKFHKKKVELSPLSSQLLQTLKEYKSTMPYPSIWQNLYPNRIYPSGAFGAPPPLRTLKRSTNAALKEALGNPPGGEDWVQTSKGSGYKLSHKVKWQFAKEEGDRNLMPNLSSSQNEFIVKDDEGFAKVQRSERTGLA